MNDNAPVNVKLEMNVWARPVPGTTVDDLLRELADHGSTVLAVDRANNRVLVMRHQEG